MQRRIARLAMLWLRQLAEASRDARRGEGLAEELSAEAGIGDAEMMQRWVSLECSTGMQSKHHALSCVPPFATQVGLRYLCRNWQIEKVRWENSKKSELNGRGVMLFK